MGTSAVPLPDFDNIPSVPQYRGPGGLLGDVGTSQDVPTVPVTPPSLTGAMNPSLLQRILGGLKSAGSGLQSLGSGLATGYNRIEDAMTPDPTGLQGLVDPGQIQQAKFHARIKQALDMIAAGTSSPGRPGLAPGAAFARSYGVGGDSYNSDINSALQQNQTGLQLSRQNAQRLYMQHLAEKYAPVEGESAQQASDRVKAMYTEAAGSGLADPTMLEKVGTFYKDTTRPPQEQRDFKEIPSVAIADDPINGIRKGQNVIEMWNAQGTQKLGQRLAQPKDTTIQQAAELGRRSSEGLGITKNFNTETKDYQEAAAGYGNLKAALAQPGPGSTQAALQGLARIINPQTTRATPVGSIEALKNMGGADMQIQRWISMATKGELPPAELQEIKHRADLMMSQRRALFTASRESGLQQGRTLGIDLTPNLRDPMGQYQTSDPAAFTPGYTPAPGGNRIPQFVPR